MFSPLQERRMQAKSFPERLSSLRNELRALSALGKIDEINRAIEESFTFPPQSMNPGSLMYQTGRALRAHGFREASFQYLNRALEWYGGRPQEERKTQSHKYAIARILYYLEDWGESQKAFKGLYKEQPKSIEYLGVLGSLAARMGDKKEAKRISEELKNIVRPYLFGSNTYWCARIATLLGDKEQAVELIRDSLVQGRTYSILYWNIDFESLEDYPPFVELKKPRG